MMSILTFSSPLGLFLKTSTPECTKSSHTGNFRFYKVRLCSCWIFGLNNILAQMLSIFSNFICLWTLNVLVTVTEMWCWVIHIRHDKSQWEYIDVLPLKSKPSIKNCLEQNEDMYLKRTVCTSTFGRSPSVQKISQWTSTRKVCFFFFLFNS